MSKRRGSKSEGKPDGEKQGEFSTSDTVRTGFWSGPGFVNAKVEYAVVSGYAITEGDIMLGTEEELEKSNDPEYQDKISCRSRCSRKNFSYRDAALGRDYCGKSVSVAKLHGTL